MMLPALFSLYLIYPPHPPKKSLPATKNSPAIFAKPLTLFLSLVFLLFSLSLKFATLALVPLWLFLALLPLWQKITWRPLAWLITLVQKYFFDFAAFLMFLPLLTSRSQLFHPWYLLWPLIFLPFLQNKVIRHSILILSCSSLLRYLPYLWENGYATHTLPLQQTITFAPLLIYLFIVYTQKVLAYVRPKN